uniref:Uncharacterized protein n=1 Tax=Sphaerodactylus townsendi TaxID=933632 RepID=A0ACB8FR71_9SAUR
MDTLALAASQESSGLWGQLVTLDQEGRGVRRENKENLGVDIKECQGHQVSQVSLVTLDKPSMAKMGNEVLRASQEKLDGLAYRGQLDCLDSVRLPPA